MKNTNTNEDRLESIELKNFFKYIKWVVLYIVFLTGFSIMFSKVYADDINSKVLFNNENISVAFDLNDNKKIMEKL